MDNFSKIQSINNLARELMKHGQANSMDEAMRMATRQVESGEVLFDIENSVPDAPEPLVEIPESEGISSDSISSDDFIRKIQKVLDSQQSAIIRINHSFNLQSNQQQEINAKINKIIAEIAELKNEIMKLKESPLAPQLKTKEVKQGQTQFKPESSPAEQAKPSGGHVRSGNYKSEDVSIEKFFYYGNK